MEETTQQFIEVVTTVQIEPDLYMVLGLMTAFLTLILFSFYYNR